MDDVDIVNSEIEDGLRLDDGVERILLLIEGDENRRLLSKYLSEEYEVIQNPSPFEDEEEFDLCIVDTSSFSSYNSELAKHKKKTEGFLPYLLVSSGDDFGRLNPKVWERVDEVIRTPIRKAELRARLEGLLRTRRSSLELKNTREFFKSLAQTATDAILIIDDRDKIFYANEAVESLLEYKPEEIQGRDVAELVPERLKQGVREELQKIRGMNKGEVDSFRSFALHANGQEIPVRASYGTFQREGSTFVTSIIHDITELKSREERLQVINRVLRHNIRNDINVVLGQAEFIAKSPDASETKERVDAIRRNSQKILSLSERAREIEKTVEQAKESEISEVEIVGVLNNILGSLKEKNPDIEVKADLPNSFRVRAKPTIKKAIYSLIEELIDNDTSEDPELNISMSTSKPKPESISMNYAEIKISDRGLGIPESELRSLEKGRETDLEHMSGLGLWLSKWVIEESEGRISVDCNKPEGTEITISLKASDPDETLDNPTTTKISENEEKDETDGDDKGNGKNRDEKGGITDGTGSTGISQAQINSELGFESEDLAASVSEKYLEMAVKNPKDARSETTEIFELLKSERRETRLNAVWSIANILEDEPRMVTELIPHLIPHLRNPNSRQDVATLLSHVSEKYRRLTYRAIEKTYSEERKASVSSFLSHLKDEDSDISPANVYVLGKLSDVEKKEKEERNTVSKNRSRNTGRKVNESEEKSNPNDDPTPKSKNEENKESISDEEESNGESKSSEDEFPDLDSKRDLDSVEKDSKFDHLEHLENISDKRFTKVSKVLGLTKSKQIVGALKILQPHEYLENENFSQKFSRQIDLWEKIDGHKNIVEVHDWGTKPRPWVIMEYVGGGSLRNLFRDKNSKIRIDTNEKLENALMLAEGVSHAHSHGVLHYGIKPESVLYDRTLKGRFVPRLSNWGISKTFYDNTHSYAWINPRYAAPEYFDRSYGKLDQSTDIFHLGVVIYKLLVGRPPHRGKPHDVMKKILEEEIEPPSNFVSDLPPEVDSIIAKATAKHKIQRYENVKSMRNDLRKVVKDR